MTITTSFEANATTRKDPFEAEKILKEILKKHESSVKDFKVFISSPTTLYVGINFSNPEEAEKIIEEVENILE